MATTLHLGLGFTSPEFDFNDYSPFDPSGSERFAREDKTAGDDEEGEENVKNLLKARARKSMIAQASSSSLLSPPPPLPPPPLTSVPTLVRVPVRPELPRTNNVMEKVKMMEEKEKRMTMKAKPTTPPSPLPLALSEDNFVINRADSTPVYTYMKPKSRQQVPTAPASPASAWRPPPEDTFSQSMPLPMKMDMGTGIVDRVIDHLVTGGGKRGLVGPPPPLPSPSVDVLPFLPSLAHSRPPQPRPDSEGGSIEIEVEEAENSEDGEKEAMESQTDADESEVNAIIDAYALFTASLSPSFPSLPFGPSRNSLSLPASPIPNSTSLAPALPHTLNTLHLPSHSPTTFSRQPATSYTPTFTPLALRPLDGRYGNRGSSRASNLGFLTPGTYTARRTPYFLDTPSEGMYDLFRRAVLGLGGDQGDQGDQQQLGRIERVASMKSMARASKAWLARKDSLVRRKSERVGRHTSDSVSRPARVMESPPPLPSMNGMNILPTYQESSSSSASSSSVASSSVCTDSPPAYAALTTNSPQENSASKKPILSRLNVDIPSSTLPRFHLHTPYQPNRGSPRVSLRKSYRFSRRPSTRLTRSTSGKKSRISVYPSSAHPSSRPSLAISPKRTSAHPLSAQPSGDHSHPSLHAEYTAYEYIYTYVEERGSTQTQTSARVVVRSATLTTTFATGALSARDVDSYISSSISSSPVSFRINRNRFGGDFSRVAERVMAELVDFDSSSASATDVSSGGHEWEDEVIVLRSADIEELREIDVTPTVPPIFLGDAPKRRADSERRASTSRQQPSGPLLIVSPMVKRKPVPLPPTPPVREELERRMKQRVHDVERELEGAWIRERAKAARAGLPPIPAAPRTPAPPPPPKEGTDFEIVNSQSQVAGLMTKFVEDITPPQSNSPVSNPSSVAASSPAVSMGSGSDGWNTIRGRLEGSIRRSPDSGKHTDGVITDVRALLSHMHSRTPSSASAWTLQTMHSDVSSTRRIGDKLKDLGIGRKLFGKKKEKSAIMNGERRLPEIPVGSPFMVFGDEWARGAAIPEPLSQPTLALNPKDLAQIEKREKKERKELEKRAKKERKRQEAEKRKDRPRVVIETSWDFLDGEYTPTPITATVLSAKISVFSPPKMIIGSPRLGMTVPIPAAIPSPSSLATTSTGQRSTSSNKSRGRQVPFPIGARPLVRRGVYPRRGSDASATSIGSNITVTSGRRTRRPGRTHAAIRGPPPSGPLPGIPLSSSSPYVL